MAHVFAIDPGFTESGWLLCESHPFRILDLGITSNADVLRRCERRSNFDVVVIEHIAMGGMIAGQETFDTCFEAGRFAQAARRFVLLKRMAVKMHLCGDSRAKDANIRQALLDRFGGSKAKGTKKAPGPLHGVKDHVWSALALAVTWIDGMRTEKTPPGAPMLPVEPGSVDGGEEGTSEAPCGAPGGSQGTRPRPRI